MKLGVCEWNIPVNGLEARFEWAAEVGLRAIEVDLENAEGNESLVRELSERLNIAVPTLGLNACCANSMCDPVQHPVIEKAFDAAIQTALALHIPKLQVPSFGKSWIDSDADFEQTVECYRLLLSKVAGTGLLVGTENGLSAKKQLELLERVGSEQLKIYFDTRNAFAMAGLNSAEILSALYPHVIEVHLKDGLSDEGPSKPLTQGNSGFAECMAILRERQFDGWMLLENNYASIDDCRTDMKTASNALKG
jgi:sugar phosphate isomerase/epimerase